MLEKWEIIWTNDFDLHWIKKKIKTVRAIWALQLISAVKMLSISKSLNDEVLSGVQWMTQVHFHNPKAENSAFGDYTANIYRMVIGNFIGNPLST